MQGTDIKTEEILQFETSVFIRTLMTVKIIQGNQSCVL